MSDISKDLQDQPKFQDEIGCNYFDGKMFEWCKTDLTRNCDDEITLSSGTKL